MTKLIAVACATAIVIVSSPWLNAFHSIADLGSGVFNDHRGITLDALDNSELKDCELSKVADVAGRIDFDDYVSLPQFGLIVNPVAFPAGITTAEYDAGHHFDRLVAKVPGQQQWHSEEHDQAFERGARYVRSQLDLAEQLFAIGENTRDAGIVALGKGLHAIQDFFAHSNFVEPDVTDAQRQQVLEALYRRGELPKNVVKLTDSNAVIVDDEKDPKQYSHRENAKDWGGVFYPAARLRAVSESRKAILKVAQALRGGCKDEDGREIGVVGSMDPNDKAGPAGAGEARFIAGAEQLRYALYFENLATATAAAQIVTLTDQLDPSLVDLNTFSVSAISFGAWTITPPPGLARFETTVDLRPAEHLLVRISVELSKPAGLLSVRFESLDPSTGRPPEDPEAGFLPPNVVSPEGQGALLFTITPKAGLSTGIVIRNHASIVFDVNAPILTPEWFNALDNDAPSSSVSGLPPASGPDVQLHWDGDDAGSGVEDYSVFVAEDGGAYVPVVERTSATSTVFRGRVGHSYSFYSLARDRVGNVEAPKDVGETTTQIVADATPPLVTPHVSGPLGANSWYVGPVVVEWTVEDPESGIEFSMGCEPFTITDDTAGVTVTCSATNGAGLSTSSSQFVRKDQTPPDIFGLPLNCSMWPPNGRLVTVGVVSADDGLSGLAQDSLAVEGKSNEPSLGDIVISPAGGTATRVQLAARRLGTGAGRIYELSATALDVAGNRTERSARCVVPHDQSR
jgi:hypothetical protein